MNRYVSVWNSLDTLNSIFNCDDVYWQNSPCATAITNIYFFVVEIKDVKVNDVNCLQCVELLWYDMLKEISSLSFFAVVFMLRIKTKGKSVTNLNYHLTNNCVCKKLYQYVFSSFCRHLACMFCSKSYIWYLLLNDSKTSSKL